ncbi:hypothetical protein [Rhodoferax ferrireducens]|uniref:hypothetical protein n=1 Tax=Rhodoferax ferrireducens TaxID=192843 RepID=UPI00140FB74F|nr:hypothetical protein [Rhodoferax ferrireducens]
MNFMVASLCDDQHIRARTARTPYLNCRASDARTGHGNRDGPHEALARLKDFFCAPRVVCEWPQNPVKKTWI